MIMNARDEAGGVEGKGHSVGSFLIGLIDHFENSN